MKKYLYLFICTIICLVFLAGCGNNNSNISIGGMKNTITETDLNQTNDIIDWKPTEFDSLNYLDGVTMTVKEETVSPSKLVVLFTNNSTRKCIFGEFFSLEKKLNEKWYQVPVAISGNYGFNSIGYNLPPGENMEFTVDWKWLYGSLDTGEYRIVKDILDFRGTGDYDIYYLAGEFSIN